ncbi:MAG TPA: ABC transporter permease [Gemmatimonadaceae bacterium]|jgi:putative ABC transport system permease protein
MSWIDALRERASNLFAPSDQGLDEEITHHLELETRRQLGAGVDAVTARKRALAKFGDPRRVADATRVARGDQRFAGSAQDFRWAARSLRKSPGFTTLALVTLALGIGATTASFSVLDTVLLRPLPFPSPDKLVVLEELTNDKRHMYPSYPNFDDWRTQTSSFTHVASTSPGFMRVTDDAGATVRARLLGISRDFFATFGVVPYLGREFNDAESRPGGPRVAMASYEFWQDHLKGDASLGIIHNGADVFRIVGIAPKGFELEGRKYDLFTPHERSPGTVRNAHYLTVYARVKPMVSLQSAQAEMTTLAARLASAFGNDEGARDVSITPLREHSVGNQRGVLVVVFLGAALVLIVACTNLVSAQLARGVVRQRETAVRAALGASRTRLLRQLLAESALLAIVGAALGIALAFGLTAIVRTVGAGLLPRLSELSIDTRVLGFVVVTTCFVATAIGIYPAVRAAKRDPADVLRGAGRGDSSTVRGGVWKLLVGGQVAMAVILIAAASMLVRTLHNILNDDVGFESHGVVTASLVSGDASGPRLLDIRTTLAALPGVKDVAYSSYYPMEYGNWSAPLLRPNDPPDHDWPAIAGYRVVTPNFFDVLRLPIVRGRGFTSEDRDGSPYVTVVSTSVASKLWPNQNPIGQRVRSNQDVEHELSVVGVVNEAVDWTQPRGSQYEIYVPFAQHLTWLHDPIAIFRSDTPTAIIAEVRSAIRANAPDIPATVALLDSRVAATAASRRFAMVAIVAFGAIALILASIGIYGVLAYTVTTRRFEIGVRMALGATSHAILRRTLGSAAMMALSGIGVGVVGALLATRYIAKLLYGVTPSDPVAYAAGAILLLAAALLGAYAPARRASRVDPLSAIRGEA